MAHWMSNRVLKINVGFLLSAGPGNNHDSTFDFPAVRVADDVLLHYLRGPLRLSRTAEGILVQAQLAAGLDSECYRCLDSLVHAIHITVEELYAHPAQPTSAFSIGDDAILDLAPLLREEVLIAGTRGVLCRPDCQGLCPDCGINRNHQTCTCADDTIDPRLAALKKFLD